MIWGHVLHVEHVSCVITNFGLHPFSLNSSLGLAGKHYQKITSLSLDLFFKVLLFQVAFLIFFSFTIFSPYFLLDCLFIDIFLLQEMALHKALEPGHRDIVEALLEHAKVRGLFGGQGQLWTSLANQEGGQGPMKKLPLQMAVARGEYCRGTAGDSQLGGFITTWTGQYSAPSLILW